MRIQIACVLASAIGLAACESYRGPAVRLTVGYREASVGVTLWGSADKEPVEPAKTVEIPVVKPADK